MIEDSDAQASVPCPRTEITDAETVVEVFARETRHMHGMLAWPGTQALKNLVLAAEERGRRAGIEEAQLGTCRVYTHGCADGRASESRLSDRWREHALPHPKRDNCTDWIALAPRDSGKEG